MKLNVDQLSKAWLGSGKRGRKARTEMKQRLRRRAKREDQRQVLREE